MTSIQSSRRFVLLLGLLVCLTGLALASSVARSAADPGAFLIDFGQRASAELNDTALSEIEREQRFRSLFNEAVDVPAIGKFVLGVHWRRASEQERADFLNAFEDMALQRFLPMFLRQDDEYRGTGFEVVKVRYAANNDRLAFVEALVERETGEPVRLEWRLREKDNQLKILDVSAEGISMVLTLREEYASVIAQTGSVGGLVERLRERIKSGLPAKD